MKQANSFSAEVILSPENQQFCDNLLALANWLDSQDLSYKIVDFNRIHGFYSSPNNPSLIHPKDVYAVLGVTVDSCSFADPRNTNKERVLAVLMVRAAILAGDSFQ